MSTNTANVNSNETGSKRQALNFWVDTVTTLAMAGLIGTGMIMKWILPPGTCDLPGSVKVWLTHPRHWWGGVHFGFSVALFVLIILHAYLHWSWVQTVWRKLVGGVTSPKSWALGAGLAVLMVVPWVIPPAFAPLTNPADDPCATCAEKDICGEAGNPAATAACTETGTPDAADPCATCPEAGNCGEQPSAENAAKPQTEAAAADPCATCPDAENCSEAS